MVKMRGNVVLLLLIFFSAILNGQNLDKSNVVFFKDAKLNELLQTIITTENTCTKNGKIIDWYIDFKDENRFVVSKGRIGNLLEVAKIDNKSVHSTSINGKLVFILTAYDDGLYSKTRFCIDMTEYLDKAEVVFEDFSSWLIENRNGIYSIKDKRVFNCNK